jgi:hypothetical protein
MRLDKRPNRREHKEHRGSGAFCMAVDEVVSRMQRSDNVATKKDESSVRHAFVLSL